MSEAPRLHLLTDDRILAREDFVEVAEAILERGGARMALHLRGPRTSGRDLWARGRALSSVTAESGASLRVNDRVDLALALGADGVHLGARSLPPGVVRALAGETLRIGRSVHGIDEVVSLENASHLEALDYLMVGTLFPTPSHPDREGGGPERLARIRERTSLPLVGVGGITPERVAALATALPGMRRWGIALIRGVWEAASPPDALERYLEALEMTA